MIGRLTGTLAEKTVEAVLIDVGGVGYEVHCPLTVLERMPPSGATAALFVHTHVREDQIALFGFNSSEERALFRMLIAVTGVGPKLATVCLGGLPAETLARAIIDNDLKRLSSIPGIGKRTAERLVLELRDKLAKSGGVMTPRTPSTSGHLEDLQSALVNLGYRSNDVGLIIAALQKESPTASFEELLRLALKRLI